MPLSENQKSRGGDVERRPQTITRRIQAFEALGGVGSNYNATSYKPELQGQVDAFSTDRLTRDNLTTVITSVNGISITVPTLGIPVGRVGYLLALDFGVRATGLAQTIDLALNASASGVRVQLRDQIPAAVGLPGAFFAFDRTPFCMPSQSSLRITFGAITDIQARFTFVLVDVGEYIVFP